jgi:hypothetical protein
MPSGRFKNSVGKSDPLACAFHASRSATTCCAAGDPRMLGPRRDDLMRWRRCPHPPVLWSTSPSVWWRSVSPPISPCSTKPQTFLRERAHVCWMSHMLAFSFAISTTSSPIATEVQRNNMGGPASRRWARKRALQGWGNIILKRTRHAGRRHGHDHDLQGRDLCGRYTSILRRSSALMLTTRSLLLLNSPNSPLQFKSP